MFSGVCVADSMSKLKDSASIVFAVAAFDDVSNIHGLGANGCSCVESILMMVECMCRFLLLYLGGVVPGILYSRELKEVGVYSPLFVLFRRCVFLSMDESCSTVGMSLGVMIGVTGMFGRIFFCVVVCNASR